MLRNYFLINLILLIIVGMLGLRLYKTWVKPLDIAAQKTLQELIARYPTSSAAASAIPTGAPS